jgi:hypothetical protein
MSEDNYS